ncbi:MAG: HTTM domain-containing protein [Actinomycetota bacterium]
MPRVILRQRLSVLRVLVGGFALVHLLVRAPHLRQVARFDAFRFDPVGPLGFLDRPLSPVVVDAVLIAAVVLGVAFVAGWKMRVAGPAFAVVLLVLSTYRNSWGQVFHTENLFVLHVLVIGLATPFIRADRDDDHGWPVDVCALITVLTYAVAGWAKIRHGGWAWIDGDALRHQVAYDNVRKAALGDTWSSLGAALVRQGWVFGPLAIASLAVEMLAPLALLRRRSRAAWAVAAWAFHVGIVALMAVVFAYPLSGIAFAPLFRLERLVDALPRRYRRTGWSEPVPTATIT